MISSTWSEEDSNMLMRRSKSRSERNHTQPHHCWAEQSPMSKNSYTAKEAKGHNPKPHLPSPQNSFLSTKENLPSKQTLELHLGWPSKTSTSCLKGSASSNPNSTGGHTIQAHLQDIDFYLEMRPHVTDRDRLYLLRATSSSGVRNFLDRQPSRTKSDYQLLREVLIKEFTTDPDSEHGLLTALETKQGRQEAPQAYYKPTPTSLLWCTQWTWPWRGCELQKPLPKKPAPWSQPPSRRHGLSTLHDHPTVAWPNTEGLQ